MSMTHAGPGAKYRMSVHVGRKEYQAISQRWRVEYTTATDALLLLSCCDPRSEDGCVLGISSRGSSSLFRRLKLELHYTNILSAGDCNAVRWSQL